MLAVVCSIVLPPGVLPPGVLPPGAFLDPIQTASADPYDLVIFDGVFGGTVSKFSGQRKWQPSLWLDGSYGVAGPLHIGAYFQWLGRSWPLDDPGFGGGAQLALRANVQKLRISGAFAGGTSASHW